MGSRYLYEVRVFAPTTGEVETNRVTDPYSVALTLGSTRSVAVDLDRRATQPAVWRTSPSPRLRRAVDSTIYELHVRDFSVSDPAVPAAHRGSYLAFDDEAGRGYRHLQELARAGLDTVHLLPTFDIASIPEDPARQKSPDCDLAGAAPDSEQQQACVAAVAADDAFNWGYDPWHWMAPEGSYASSAAAADGAARVAEFRTMVGGLHKAGLRVVLDQVFNHTPTSGQAETSVLDRIVPGYYQRLDARGAVETSTCCQNVATENAMGQKIMVDAVVSWARHYHVDGFRFDLMGHHSRANMLAVRAALDALTVRRDGVDGKRVYLYGEGWNFGEVADGARFRQATQGQLGGTGIGTFSDRLRDAVRGGGPFDEDPRLQGLGSGLVTDPNDAPQPDARRRGCARPPTWPSWGWPATSAAFRFTSSAGTPVPRRPGRLQRLPGRLRRPARRGDQLRRRARQRDVVRRAHLQAAGRDGDGGPGADEHRRPVLHRPGPDAVVLARGHRPAAQQEPRPQLLRLGRLVQHAGLDGGRQRLRPRPAAEGRQRGEVALPEAAAGRPGAQAHPGRRLSGPARRPRTCCGCAPPPGCSGSARRG